MSLLAHVAHLRTLAALDPDTTMLQVAMINVMEEMAEAIDGLRGRLAEDDPDPPRGFGTI